jgi:DNA-directed RNA polymerase sigma subunit (sigma70/sigma32)
MMQQPTTTQPYLLERVQVVTYSEVAQRLGLSEFMVRRIEQVALRKLRTAGISVFDVTGWDEP